MAIGKTAHDIASHRQRRLVHNSLRRGWQSQAAPWRRPAPMGAAAGGFPGRRCETAAPVAAMRAEFRRWLLAGAALLGLLCAALSAGAQGLNDTALVAALRDGGLNIYFRHAATEWSQSDDVREAGDWTSCDAARMRQLSATGRADARLVGASMRALGMPVGNVYASPYCRTVETATLFGMGEVQPTVDVMNLRAADYVGGQEAVIERARQRLSTLPAPGSNDVYVAHGNIAVAATRVYPDEAEGLVFRPLGENGFEYVGRLDPARWSELADRHGAN